MQPTALRELLARRLTTRSALWLFFLIAACGPRSEDSGNDGGLDPLPAVALPERVIKPGTWDTVFMVGGSPEDTTLLMPRTLAGGFGRVVAFDYGDNRVKSFGPDGRLLWASGGPGGGPGEFEGNFGLQIDRQGRVWAADPDLGRLTVLDDTGGVFSILGLSLERLAGVAIVDGRPIVISSSPAATLFEVDPDGVVVERYPPPLAALKSLPDFARSVVVASNGGATWTMAYPYGNLFVVYEGFDLRCAGKLLTGAAFPLQSVRQPIFSVSAIAIQDSMVVVLGNGGGEGRNRHLDRYSLSDCRYLGSMELPSRFAAMAYVGDFFVLESHDPAPTLTALRWQPQVELPE